jgi:hypothetical protein
MLKEIAGGGGSQGLGKTAGLYLKRKRVSNWKKN